MTRLACIVLVAMTASAQAKPTTGDMKGKITIKNKKVAKGVVVYLEGVPGDPPKQKNAVIKQREKQFDPPVTIVVKGTTVDFPNEDKIFHNVFSVSPAKRFDLGIVPEARVQVGALRQARLVNVYCDIHVPK